MAGTRATLGAVGAEMNARSKGQRNELKAQRLLEKWGYTVFRLYQPMMAPQGPIDLIAVGMGRVRFVQVRSGQWGDLRALKALEVPEQLTATKEVWRFDDRVAEPKQRVLE